jgi:NADPH:quinone reductase-like Zn-dependent oxidoreductase
MLAGQITQLVRSPFVSQRFMTLMAKLNQKDLNTISALIEEGKVTPVIDRRYNLSEVPAAVRYLGEAHARGKVIINLDSNQTNTIPAQTRADSA